jgi:hypothetical protein
MRQFDRIPAERLAKAFKQTFLERKRIDIDPSEFWTAGVMSEVRRIGPLNGQHDFWTIFERLTWRFIPAAVAIVLLLGVAISQIDPAPDNIVADIYREANLDSGPYAFYDR